MKKSPTELIIRKESEEKVEESKNENCFSKVIGRIPCRENMLEPTKIIRGINIKSGKELVVFLRKSDTVLSAYSFLKLKKNIETYGLNVLIVSYYLG